MNDYKRLTTDNPTDNFETMLNMVFSKDDGWAYIRDGESGTPIQDFVLGLCWKSGCDITCANNESLESKDQHFCDCCFEQCPIADVYAALSGFSHVRDRLKQYEDTGLSPERAAELGKADAEGRVRILPEAVSGTCGSCAYFHRAKGTRSGTCVLRPYRVSKWSPAKYPFRPSQSQKGCKRYQEAARGEHNVDDTDQ